MKPALCIKLANYNIVSFGALLGAIPKDLFERFDIFIWRENEILPANIELVQKCNHSFSQSPGKKLQFPFLRQQKVMFLFSFMMPHIRETYDAIQKIKTASLLTGFSPTIVAGGSQATCISKSVLEMGFDHVFVGEAEVAFPNFLQRWLASEPLEKIIKIEPGSVNLDLFPGFHRITGYLPPIEITRGCAYKCAYCAVPTINRGIIRHRSIDAVIEIAKKYLSVQTNRRRVKFLSPNALSYGSTDGKTPNLKAINSLLKRLKTETGIAELSFGSFPSEVRPDFVTPEILEIIAPMISNKTIVIGVQCASDEMLAKINREHTIAQAISAIKLLRSYGFTPHVDFIIGFPGETEEYQDRLLTFMEELVSRYSVRIHMHTFIPLPGTALANRKAAPISEKAKERIKALERINRLDGWWENQIAYSR